MLRFNAMVLAMLSAASAVHARDYGLVDKATQLVVSTAEEGVKQARDIFKQSSATPLHATGSIEVAFSPDHGAEELVIRATDSASADLRMMAYALTSSRITSAVVRAAKRGVKVYVLADYKQNLGPGMSPKGKAALSAMALAGVQVRVVDAYPIFHDKVQIVDGKTVQTGSFNYSEAAAKKNSENVIVHWNNQQLAQAYGDHFARNWKISKPFKPDF